MSHHPGGRPSVARCPPGQIQSKNQVVGALVEVEIQLTALAHGYRTIGSQNVKAGQKTPIRFSMSTSMTDPVAVAVWNVIT